MSEKKLFKDWFDAEAALILGQRIRSVKHDFDLDLFVQTATTGIATEEMQARVKRFSGALDFCLLGLDSEAPCPASLYHETLLILLKMLPEPVPCETGVINDNWYLWPVGDFVGRRGPDDVPLTLNFLQEFTQRFTAEFAVRPLLEKDPGTVLNFLLTQTKHPSPHVRRWCSEGIRPRLPWASQLKDFIADPEPLLPIAEALRHDTSPYVQKSVANLLNDIGKDHPDVLLAIATAWWKENGGRQRWIVNHALRVLIKQGNPSALELVGYPTQAEVRIHCEINPKTILIGGVAQWEIQLENPRSSPLPLLIDYKIDFARPGTRTSSKIFKGKRLTLAGNQSDTVTLRHPFRPTTTRQLFPGPHLIHILINGLPKATLALTLKSNIR
jgi:3-methyladenine DNA glycosylase AlkC